jgi:hypothetical protein
VHHQRRVELGLLLVPAVQLLHLQQRLELHPSVLVQAQQLLEDGCDLGVGHAVVDELVDLLLRVVLDLERRVGEEAQPDLADVPDQLVLAV